MDRTIEDKTIVVTGGTGEIGFQIAEKFLKRSARNVILLDLNEKEGENKAKELNSKYDNKATFLKCDVTKDLDEVSKIIINKYITIDVLVNCAGIIDEDNPKNCIAVNLTALVEMSFIFLKHMRTDEGGKGGTIINISSKYGILPDGRLPTYAATKHGVTGFSKVLGNNYATTGVRTIVICPGYTITQFLSLDRDLNEFEKNIADKMELYGVQKPDVVGEAVAEVFTKADTATVWIIEKSKLSQYI